MEEDRTSIYIQHQRWGIAHQLFWRGGGNVEPQRKISCDVTIIGAGPAGLASAWFLQQLGYDVLVLENEPTIGGATRTEAWNNVLLPCGATYFAEPPDTFRELLNALQLTPVPLPDDALWLSGTPYRNFWHDSVLSELPIPEVERAAFRRFRTDIESLPPFPFPLPDVLPDPWRALAAQPAEAVVNTYTSPTLRSLLNAYARSVLGAPLKDISAACLYDFYRAELAWQFLRPRYSLRGGLASLCQRLAEHIGSERILLQCLAFRIEHVSNTCVRTLGITARGESIAIESGAAVFAGPKLIAKHLIPELPPAQQQAILRLQYIPYLTVHLVTPFRLVPEDTFGLWLPEAQLVTDIADTTPLHPQPVEGFLSCLYVPLSRWQRKLLLEEESIRSLATAAVREVLQLLAPEWASNISELACFAWGHALIIPTPIALLGAAQQARRPVGHIVFANTDNEASPAIENAIEQAARAAEIVHALLHSHSTAPLVRRLIQTYPLMPCSHAHPLQPVDRTVTNSRTATSTSLAPL